MQTIVFFQWKLFVDNVSTRLTYSGDIVGGAESCPCDNCKNYLQNRESAFPEVVRELLDTLGIDYTKDCEVTHYCKTADGLHHYGGWFHFKGDFIGPDCARPLPNGGYTVDLVALAPNFSIGFRKDSSLSFFADETDLVQVEFEVDIPWLIDAPESD